MKKKVDETKEIKLSGWIEKDPNRKIQQGSRKDFYTASRRGRYSTRRSRHEWHEYVSGARNKLGKEKRQLAARTRPMNFERDIIAHARAGVSRCSLGRAVVTWNNTRKPSVCAKRAFKQEVCLVGGTARSNLRAYKLWRFPSNLWMKVREGGGGQGSQVRKGNQGGSRGWGTVERVERGKGRNQLSRGENVSCGSSCYVDGAR